MPCFKTADAASLTQAYVSIMDTNRGILNRATRRRMDHSPISEIECLARASTPVSASSSAEKKTFVLQVQMPASKKARPVSNEEKITEWSLKLDQLAKAVECLQKFPGNEGTVARLEAQMQELGVLLSNATESMISEASQAAPDDFGTPH